MKLTHDDLEAWRANPVTQRLLGLKRRQAAMQRALLLRRCWAERVAPDPWAHSLCETQFVLVDDLLTASTDDIEKLETEVAEHERHPTDQS